MRIVITRTFLEHFFGHIFSHIGWSESYERYIIVEPVCYIQRVENKLVGCKCVDEVVYGASNVGETVSDLIDSEPGDFVEQVMVHDLLEKKEWVLICDNPILFPYERILKFVEHLKVNREIIYDVAGISHYHINEVELNEQDLKTLQYYTEAIMKMGGAKQIGLVISQWNPSNSLKLLTSGRQKFVKLLFRELQSGKINVTGKIFGHKKLRKLDIVVDI